MNFKKTLTAVTIALGLTVGMQTITESSNLFNPQTVQAASKKYVKAKMKLPKGYTRSALLKAYQGKPSASFIKASMKGMKDNDFSRIKLVKVPVIIRLKSILIS